MSAGGHGGYKGAQRGGGRGGGGYAGGRGGSRGGAYPLRQLQKSTRIVDEKYSDNYPKISKWIQPEAAASTLKPPHCKGVGTLRQKVLPIETNHVGIQIDFPDLIYHYEIVVKYGEKPKDVKPQPTEIKPKLWQKIVKLGLRLIEERHEKLGGKRITVASDYSKALYTRMPLLGIKEHYTLSASELDSTNTFIISVNETKSVIETKSLSPVVNNMRGHELLNLAEIEQIYNIVLKTNPLNRFVNVGRAGFFDPLQVEGFHLGGGLVNVAGFSLICTFGWKPFLNIDVSNSVFVKGGQVLDLLRTLFQEDRIRGDPADVGTWDSNAGSRATELLKGCQITYVFNGKSTTRRVTEVLQKIPTQSQFIVEGKQTNVADYFLSKGLKLHLPNGPCLVLNNNSTVPAEICKVERGHHFSRRLTDRQTASMITDTAKPPSERKKRILDSIKSCQFEVDRVLKEFGVIRFGGGKNSTQLLSFDQCRILPTPSIHYGRHGEKQIFPINGVWNIFEYEFQFIDGAVVGSWTILNLTGRTIGENNMDLERFVKQFTTMANDAGLRLPQVSGNVMLDTRSKAFQCHLTEYFQNIQASASSDKKSFVLVVIPSKNHECYGRVKKIAELDVGVLTQCIAEVNVKKCQKATLGNIILKLNAKLGGTDHFVNMNGALGSRTEADFLTHPTLFIGADVTHPAANSLMPSVAAVTACYDRFGMRYSMHPQVQKRADKNAAEVIENLDLLVSEMIKNFRSLTNVIPRKIIYFRDGVGDGQYAEVLEKELGALRRACYLAAERNHNYKPQISIIVVQKRHKTRFFVKNSSDGIGKSGNCPPGAVIDSEIVHPTEMDFYLLSHQGIQGTSRPTRYHLLWDDSEFTADEIQMLTYSLCHGYSRCTRSVSIPAPTYYAHLAAYRVRCLIETLPSSTYTDVKKLNEMVKRNKCLTDDFPMHFI